MAANVVSAPKSANLDFRKSLLETFAINEKANQLLLSHVAEAAWQIPPPSGKGRSIGAIAVHIHHVRLMWLSAADKTGKHPAKLDPDKATRAQVQTALKSSAASIHVLLEKALNDPAGKVPNFKPDVVGFVGYLIAHDSHHRGQIAMLARQVGHPVPAQTGFGLWEWGSLWRECGFGK
ncbi:MAG TPA: DinB family protein [Verrucomicrobiae bacterium]|nr:DinB family protein [Verrucomicrobiae bacterium]